MKVPQSVPAVLPECVKRPVVDCFCMKFWRISIGVGVIVEAMGRLAVPIVSFVN